MSDLRDRVKGSWKVSSRSTLILAGEGPVAEVDLDGAVRVTEARESLTHQSPEVPEYAECAPDAPEELRIRGFTLIKRDTLTELP